MLRDDDAVVSQSVGARETGQTGNLGQLPRGGLVGIVCSVIFCLQWHPISFLYATYWVCCAATAAGTQSWLRLQPGQRVSSARVSCLSLYLSVSLAYGISNFKAYSPTTMLSMSFCPGSVYIVRVRRLSCKTCPGRRSQFALFTG